TNSLVFTYTTIFRARPDEAKPVCRNAERAEPQHAPRSRIQPPAQPTPPPRYRHDRDKEHHRPNDAVDEDLDDRNVRDPFKIKGQDRKSTRLNSSHVK